MAGGQLKTLIGSIRRKPATAPDRRTDDQAASAPKLEKTSLVHDIVHGSAKNNAFLAGALPKLASGEPLDDKELLLEHGVSMLQGMPPNSGLSSTVSDGFIKMLYNDLPHPSTTVAGPTARYRQSGAKNNNPWCPEMGAAFTPYARNVPPVKPKGPNLPDPELVFEQLLKRPDGQFKEHPSGLNRLFFSFATIVIHECFQTNRKNQWINETSSYVDLSTLYGNTDEHGAGIRTWHNGLIHPDSIASERIMLMPPGVVALLIMFSRNHNAISKDLLSINEEGKYRPWDSLSEEEKKWQDNDIFQLARNINVGFFATVVLKDYVAAILNTPRANSTWSLDLGKEIKSMGQRVERGTGNVVSVEFAVLYHWHAALSAADAQWMEQLLRHNLPDLKSLDDMTPDMFKRVLMQEGHKLIAPKKDWTFWDLKRGEDGSFDDTELAELIKDCIEEPAHAFGPHGTPASLKVVDIMGQLQAREVFNVCTLNEFRQYLNLKAYNSFEEWCEDDETAQAARLLYGHIDNMELYPGLMAECTKPAMPGSGVCPGQTTGRGILDDAVALVRGDRFLSYDFNSNTLTNWGVSNLGSLPGGTYGGMLPKLIIGGLPASFSGTSSYALLPFYTPTACAGILKGNKVTEKYDHKRPQKDYSAAVVYTLDGVKNALSDRDTIRSAYPEPRVVPQIFFDDGMTAEISSFFGSKTNELIKRSSLKYPGVRRSINIVRDVTNITPISWLARRLAIPIKSTRTPRGLYSVPELFDIFMGVFQHDSFANVLAINQWQLREKHTEGTAALKRVVEAHLKTQQGFKEKFVDWMEKGTAYEVLPDADRMYHALNNTKRPINELSEEVVRLAAPMAAVITQQASLLIDLFLSEGHEEYKQRIIELAQKDDEVSAKEMEAFVFEGMRHAGVVPGLLRTASRDTVIQDGARGPVSVKARQTVILATSVAGMDSAAFSSPEKLNPDRALEEHKFILGENLARVVGPACAAILKEVFKLKNIRRSRTRAGHFVTVEREVEGVKVRYYLDSNAKESPFPTSLMLEYEEDVSQANGMTNGVNGVNGVNGSH